MKKNNTRRGKKTMLVGITGGIGVGKSFCAEIFKWLGVPLYIADKEAKLIMIQDQDVKAAIIDLFGKESYIDDGRINRKHLAKVIFSDPSQLAKMNAIVHPAVRDHFRKWADMHQNHPYIIQESALIFETGSFKLFDKVIVVDAPLELRISRTMTRDHTSREEVLARISKQYDQKEKVELADHIIHNDGRQMIIPQIIQIHHVLLDELSIT